MGLIKFLKNKFGKNVANNESEKAEIKKYEDGLDKSRKSFADKLQNLGKKYKKVNSEYFEDLEETLIEADIGVNLTLKVIEELLVESKQKKLESTEEINDLLIDKLFEGYMKDQEHLDGEVKFSSESPTVLLMVGVNGVGKTTSIAKIAYRYKSMGKKILLVAADTFRAGAKQQLNVWAERLGVDIVCGKDEQDPSSLVYEGCHKAKTENYDLVIVDTAGRLQNKEHLMRELAKMKKVINKEMEQSIIETFLVIDATTGQNGVVQAKAFFEVTALTGIIITKMDGTSKGGIILAIRDELGTPVRFIGLGEKMEDMRLFDLEKYLYSLCVSEDWYERLWKKDLLW